MDDTATALHCRHRPTVKMHVKLQICVHPSHLVFALQQEEAGRQQRASKQHTHCHGVQRTEAHGVAGSKHEHAHSRGCEGAQGSLRYQSTWLAP